MRYDISKLYKTKNPIVKYYFKSIAYTILKILKHEDNLILDFGCGQQYLKEIMPDKRIIGYDIIKEYSDIKDYKKLKGCVVVACHVFEHISIGNLIEIFKDFNRMNIKYLVVAQPTENILTKIGLIFHRLPEHKEHSLRYKEIYSILNEYFTFLFERNVLTMTKVSVWKI